MAATAKFRNATKRDVKVMEGREGVFRDLCNLRPRDSLTASIKTGCNFRVCDVKTFQIVDVPASIHLESDRSIIEIVDIRDDFSQFDGFLAVDVREKAIMWKIPGYVAQGVFANPYFRQDDRPDLNPDTNRNFDAEFVERAHIHEIGSLCWIKWQSGMYSATPELARQVLAGTALELWKSKEKVFRLEIDGSQAELKDCSNHIFQWVIGFYTVVHGILFTVVSQPESPFTCSKIYISYILSAIVSFVTIVGVIRQLKTMETLNETIHDHSTRVLAICRWQLDLKSKGQNFDFGSAKLIDYGMPKKAWWQPKFLPLKAVKYICVIVACSAVLCYIMQLLKCVVVWTF